MNQSSTTTRPSRLVTKTALYLAPAVALVMLCCFLSAQRLFDANEKEKRRVEVQSRTEECAHQLESVLETCRQDLLLVAAGAPDGRGWAQRFADWRRIRTAPYGALFWVPDDLSRPTLLADGADELREYFEPGLRRSLMDALRAGGQREALQGGVRFVGGGAPLSGESAAPFFLFALPRNETALGPGVLFLSLDARALRNKLPSLPKADAAAGGWSDERFAWFADADGWILFQSGPEGEPDSRLETYLARTGLRGALGKPGYASAFRPMEDHGQYWRMMAAVLSENGDEAKIVQWPDDRGVSAVAPVRLPGLDQAFTPVGVVVYTDRHRGVAPGVLYPLSLLLALAGFVVLIVCLAVAHKLAARPLRELADALQDDDALAAADRAARAPCREARRVGEAVHSILQRGAQQEAMSPSAAGKLREPAVIQTNGAYGVAPSGDHAHGAEGVQTSSMPIDRHGDGVLHAKAFNARRPAVLQIENGLSSRQATALSEISRRGVITRNEYQQIVGDGLPARTAIHDLNDLVRRGLLTRQGRGPATRYVVVSSGEAVESSLEKGA
ncbi:MAG: two-component system, NtrC family, response regulator HydG [Desulfovibrionales bacterium]|nr:two-component system, NtrC family, response regulator HydG [Desulfovibrionales bacterium]